MARDSAYQPVSAGDEEKVYNWDDTTEIIPTHTRSFVFYLSVLFISLSANVLLLLRNASLKSCSPDLGKTIYSGNTFDTPVPFHSFTQYWNPKINETVADRAWDDIDTNTMAIALHDDYAKQVGLGPSTRFPWDTERSVYYVKGIHDIHCLKLLHKAIVSKHNGENQTFSLHHLFHCLDGLRQDIMCTADDTPMPAAVAHHVGDGQIRQCRDWNKLISWANRPDQHACHNFDDYREATNTLELFAFCPDDSPYLPVMKAYFEYHGHKDVYEAKGEKSEVIF